MQPAPGAAGGRQPVASSRRAAASAAPPVQPAYQLAQGSASVPVSDPLTGRVLWATRLQPAAPLYMHILQQAHEHAGGGLLLVPQPHLQQQQHFAPPQPQPQAVAWSPGQASSHYEPQCCDRPAAACRCHSACATDCGGGGTAYRQPCYYYGYGEVPPQQQHTRHLPHVASTSCQQHLYEPAAMCASVDPPLAQWPYIRTPPARRRLLPRFSSRYVERASSRAQSEPDLRYDGVPPYRGPYGMAGGGAPFRYFMALYDYDPRHMSPNPNAIFDELTFRKGQIIKVFGGKDVDGFYRGELNGRIALVPGNMVAEVGADEAAAQQQSHSFQMRQAAPNYDPIYGPVIPGAGVPPPHMADAYGARGYYGAGARHHGHHFGARRRSEVWPANCSDPALSSMRAGLGPAGGAYGDPYDSVAAPSSGYPMSARLRRMQQFHQRKAHSLDHPGDYPSPRGHYPARFGTEHDYGYAVGDAVDRRYAYGRDPDLYRESLDRRAPGPPLPMRATDGYPTDDPYYDAARRRGPGPSIYSTGSGLPGEFREPAVGMYGSTGDDAAYRGYPTRGGTPPLGPGPSFDAYDTQQGPSGFYGRPAPPVAARPSYRHGGRGALEQNMASMQQLGTGRPVVAKYDYNPNAGQSPNVDAELELCFKAGDVITIFGDMDEDGFFCGELNGRRGLVPSNFLDLQQGAQGQQALGQQQPMQQQQQQMQQMQQQQHQLQHQLSATGQLDQQQAADAPSITIDPADQAEAAMEGGMGDQSTSGQPRVTFQDGMPGESPPMANGVKKQGARPAVAGGGRPAGQGGPGQGAGRAAGPPGAAGAKPTAAGGPAKKPSAGGQTAQRKPSAAPAKAAAQKKK